MATDIPADFYTSDFPSTGDPETDRAIAENIIDGDIRGAVQLGAAAGAMAACGATGVGAAAAPLCGAVGGYIGGLAVDAFNSLFGSDPPPEPSLARCTAGRPGLNLVPPSDWGSRIATDAVKLGRFAKQVGITSEPLNINVLVLQRLARKIQLTKRSGSWTSFPSDVRPFDYYVAPMPIRNMCYLREEPNSPDAQWERKYRAAIASIAVEFANTAARWRAQAEMKGSETMTIQLAPELRGAGQTTLLAIRALQKYTPYNKKTLAEMGEIVKDFIRKYMSGSMTYGDAAEAFMHDKLVPRGFTGTLASLESSLAAWAKDAARVSLRGGNTAWEPHAESGQQPAPPVPPGPPPTEDEMVFTADLITTGNSVMGILVSPDGIEQGNWYPEPGGRMGIVISPAGIEQNAWARMS